MKNILISLMCAVVLLSGCATHPKKIDAAYVSPYKYKNYSQSQIIQEMNEINGRSIELYDELADEATADKVQMGVGLVLFWPTLFFLEGGDGVEAAEYSRLKGEYNALFETAKSKNYDLNELPQSTEKTIEAHITAKKADRETESVSANKRVG